MFLVFLKSIYMIPMNVYYNAKFDPSMATDQLNGLLEIETLEMCKCRCFNNTQCMTGNYFNAKKLCELFSAHLSQGQVHMVTDMSSVVFSFSNKTINTKSSNTPEIIQWLFDKNFNDVYGQYNGEFISTADTAEPDSSRMWLSPGYAGYGSAIKFSDTYGIVNKNLDLTTNSFTVSAWILITEAYSSPYGISNYFIIFNHCVARDTDKCLQLAVKNDYLYLGFYDDDLMSRNLLNTNQWYHIAYLYDRSKSEQIIYLNGILDCKRTASGPYAENSPKIIFGYTAFDDQFTFNNGLIDKITFVSRLKTDTELIDEATLVAFYPFDGTYNDAGPNSINNVFSVSTTFDSDGKSNQSLVVNILSPSCFRTTGFYYLSQLNYPFSFSLWIYAYERVGSILQVSDLSDWCVPMIGFDKSGYLIAQSLSKNGIYSTSSEFGKELLEKWTHISMTYSTQNGIRLYINGNFIVQTRGNNDYLGSQNMSSVTIGMCNELTACNRVDNTIQLLQFQGKIDELRIYSRELSSTEICQFVPGSACIPPYLESKV
ncbi:hypothetical protein I4U23_012936 [Adineta vaga]|nr:hypothetical protein I4U23_012936 [Adineta vaga]